MPRFIRRILFYEADPGVDMNRVRAQIMEDNRKTAVIWGSVQILYWIYCLVMSAVRPDFMVCRYVYTAALAVCAAALSLAVYAAPKAAWLIQPAAFLVDAALLGAGVGIARLLAPKTIVIFASVLLVPVFFVCDSLSTLILLAANAVAFAIAGRGALDAETYRWTLVNVCIFSSVGFLLGYFVNKARFERYFYAESARQLADMQTIYAYYDQMTGLKNRRAFAEHFDRLKESMDADTCVVTVDINGLKKMNDSLGHEAGDELIAGAAECIRQSFENAEGVYRIGGDEFCVIMNAGDEEAAERLQRLDAACSRWKGRYVNGISVSWGCASGEEFPDIDAAAKAADRRMYENKSNYYRSVGLDRRRR